MTFAEALLRATKCMANSDYSSFSEVPPGKILIVVNYAGRLMEEAAELAIASAREEGREAGYAEGYPKGYQAGISRTKPENFFDKH